MSDSEERLLVEYQAAHDSYLHHNSFPWQVGSLLIAGVFVFWGFVLDKSPSSETVAVASVLVTALMSIWELYAHQVRQIYLCKLDRIREIERQLNLEQNRRFVAAEKTSKHYRYFGPSGYQLNLAIYTLASLGGPLLGIVQHGWNVLFVFPLVLFIAVLISVLVNEKRANSMLNK